MIYNMTDATINFFIENQVYVYGNDVYIKWGKEEHQIESFKRKGNETNVEFARILGRIEYWAEKNEMPELHLKVGKIYKNYIKFKGYIELWKN
nr:MAG TPA: hypothetical protein [Microviridae sp.]